MPRWAGAQRRAVAAGVDAAIPGASESERRAAVEQQLHQDVTAEAWAKARRWEQVREQQAAAAKARAEAAAAQSADVVVDEPVAPVVLPTPRPAAVAPASQPEPAAVVDDDQELVLEELTREQVIDWRARAAHDHQAVFDHIDRYGETSARRLFTSTFVDQAQRLAGLGHLDLGYTTWEQARAAARPPASNAKTRVTRALPLPPVQVMEQADQPWKGRRDIPSHRTGNPTPCSKPRRSAPPEQLRRPSAQQP